MDDPNDKQEDTQQDVDATPAPAQEAPEGDAPDTQQADSNVKLSEEFQKQVTPLIEGATKPELEFLRSLIQEREKELMHAETKGEKSGDFDLVGMPQD